MPVTVQPLAHGVPADLGQPALPGSKSHAQRLLLLLACGGGGTLHGVPDSEDLQVLAAALGAAGAVVDRDGARWTVRPAPPLPGRTVAVHAGENATAARTLLLLVPLLGGRLRLDGAPGLRRRPLQMAVDALRAAGAAVAADRWPLVADGRCLPVGPGLRLVVDAATSTQAATGALLALALRGGGALRAVRPGASGYLDLTLAVLRQLGVAAAAAREGGDYLATVGSAVGVRGAAAVAADASARAFPVVLAHLHGLPLPAALARPADDPQPDYDLDLDLRALRAAGAAPLVLPGLAARPDAVPALAVAAAARAGRTRLPGLAVLRTKESDRLQALAAGLASAGADAVVDGDDLVVTGPLPPGGGPRPLATVPDHRIVMALGLLGTLLPGGVRLDHAGCVAKSWPGYWQWLARVAAVAGLDAAPGA